VTGPTAGTPSIRCFPSADRAFAQEVSRALASLPEPGAPDAPQRLEQLLRERYPAAAVSPQDPLASFTGQSRIWYVYRRDSPSPAPQPAGAADAEPTEQQGRRSRPIYSAAATASMVGVPISIVIGWDEQEGYVRPAPSSTGVRLYSRDDLQDLLTVKRLTTAESSPDEIRAALGAERARRRAGGRTGSGHRRRMLVLLAERDPYAAEMAEYFLRTEGYDVDVAFSNAEAESRVVERSPDVAVVELLISGGAGAELCARLKAQTAGAVVAICALDFEEAALRSGADAFLRKPYDPLELVSTIKDLLGESAMLRPVTQ
jgi:CheY-like chemotaxis protein